MPAILTTDWASMGRRGIADLPVPDAKLLFFPPPVLPVGVRVTEGTLLALVEAVEPKAEVIVVELLPRVNGLFSFPEGGWQDAQ